MPGKWDWLKEELSGFSMLTKLPTMTKFLKGKISGPDDMTKCSMCPNMCRHACPISIVDGKETTSPAGKSRIGMMIENDVLSLNEENLLPIHMCLSCGCCENWCPFDFSVSDILRPVKKRAVEKAIVYEEFVELFDNLRKNGTIYGEIEEQNNFANDGDVLYLRGCEYREGNSEVIDKTMSVLNKVGTDPFILSDEECCGIPAYNSGNIGLFEKLIEKMSERISESGADKVVTSCPSCAYAYKKLYPEFGQNIDAEISHIVEFLEEKKIKFNLKRESDEFTFHEPCKLVNGLEKKESMQDLLDRIGLSVKIPRRNGDETFCCGSGGTTVPRLNEELSSEVAQERLSELKKLSDEIITSCPTCKQTFENADEEVKVHDIAEIVDSLL